MNFSEQNHIAVVDEPVTMTASTLVTSPYINADGSEQVECILHLAASVAGATSVGKIEIVAASDAAGTGVEVVPFKDLYFTVGATKIEDGTGIAARIEQMTGDVPTAKDDYSTVGSDGDKQQQYVVPIRVRKLPAGKMYVAMRFTAGSATARKGTFMFIKTGNQYGFDGRPTNLFS